MKDAERKNTDWFMESKYGIFVHYLESLQNNPESERELSQGKKTTWEQCVNEFDVELFADQVLETGASYVFFTLMQMSRYFCAPNSTYDSYTGFKSGEACSKRDLIDDLYSALQKREIKLMLYTTGDGPFKDQRASTALKGGFPFVLNEEFSKCWSECMREFSLRYGKKVWGWWIDGCYKAQGFGDDIFFRHMSCALRSGNPDSILAFNYWPLQEGYKGEVLPVTKYENYTAGEIYQGLDINHPYPNSRWVGNEQWHVLAFLGSDWAFPDLRYSDKFLVDYVKRCTENQGVVTLDVGMNRNGSISEGQLRQLKQLKNKIRINRR